MIVLDDESDATKTVSRLETHAAQGVVAYLGGVGSDLHAAGATIAEKNRIPYLGVGFALESIHKQGYRYLFSPFWKSPQIARETYRFLNGSLPETQRPKKVALFLERTDWGREVGGYWESFGKETGYARVSTRFERFFEHDSAGAVWRSRGCLRYALTARRHDNG